MTDCVAGLPQVAPPKLTIKLKEVSNSAQAAYAQACIHELHIPDYRDPETSAPVGARHSPAHFSLPSFSGCCMLRRPLCVALCVARSLATFLC